MYDCCSATSAAHTYGNMTSIMKGLYKHPLGCSQLKNIGMMEYFIDTFNAGVDKSDK